MAEQKPATTGIISPAQKRVKAVRTPPSAAPCIVPRALRARPDLLRSTALQAVFLAAIVLPTTQPSAQTLPAATALPTGARVIAGQATIATTTSAAAASMTVTQATKYGAYDWKTFNIGSASAVTYQVPTSQSVSVNRVISPTSPSIIAGKLSSNGVLVVQNQSGVVFTQGAEVNVNTLIATAPGMSDANARAGKLIFDQPANAGARVENHGTITVAQTGLAALVAPQVANSGVIRAQMGRVVLAGAQAHTIDLYGDGLLSIDITRQVTQAAVGPDGKTATALVTNSGIILADGGTILLTASAVDGLVQNLVTAGGTLRADTASSTAGRVGVTAQGGGVTVVGTIAARGTAAGNTGGQIEINAPARSVTLKPIAVVDASGRAGGGSIAIGTTMVRAKVGPGTKAPTARDVVIESGARIAADATAAGKGGDITVLSAGGVTQFHGGITARGGAEGGAGGFVEVSGDTFVVRGPVDVSAPAGTAGTILLDPIDLVITASKTTGTPDAKAGSITTKGGAGTTNLDVADILNLTGNIVIEALGTFTVSTAIDVTGKAGIGDVAMKAGGLMTVNGAITGANNITLTTTAGSINLNSPITTTGAGKTVALNTPGSIALAGSIGAGTGTIDLNAKAGIVQTTGSLVAGTLLSSTGITGTVKLDSATNKIASLGALTVTGGDLLLVSQGALAVTGVVKVDSGRIVSLAVNGFSAAAGIDTGTGTFELAPASAGTMSLGAASAAELVLTQAALGNVTAGTIQLGKASAGGTTATSIALNDALDTSVTASTTRLVAGAGGITLTKGPLTAGTLDITTIGGGGITDKGGAIVATRLQSTAGITGAVAMDKSGHSIVSLGDMKITGGGLVLIDVVALNVAGNVQAAGDTTLLNLAASAKAIEVTGTLALSVAGKGLSLVTDTTGGITLAGTVDATAGGSLNFAAGTLGVAQTGGAVTTGLLVSTSGGTVKLAQSANNVGLIGDLTVTTGDFTLATGTAVTVTGALSAANVSITGGAAAANAIAISGSVTANGAVGVVILAASDAGKGGIALSGAVTASKGAIDLAAGAGGIVQTTGSLTTPSLISTGGIAGTASLTSASNAIGAIGSIKVNGGNLLLASATTLDIAGTLAVDAGKTISLGVNGFKLSTGALSAAGGTVEIAPLTTAAMSLGKAAATELTVTGADLAKISSATLRLGGATASAATADSLFVRDTFDASTAATAVLRLDAGANGISIDSGVTLKANTLDLNTTGSGVNAIAGSLISAIRLQSSAGITGNVALANDIQAIGTLGDFAVKTGALRLRTSLAIDIAGAASADIITIVSGAASANAISGTGSLSTPAGGTIALTASDPTGGIALAGKLDATATGTIDLSTAAGGITQSAGSITAGTLISSSGIAGTVKLAQAGNAVGTVGDFAVTTGDFTLASSIATTISGALSAANVTLTDSAATAKALIVSGTVKATGDVALSATNKAGGIALSGTVDAGGTLDLTAGTGGVTQTTGAVFAGTLFSSGNVAGTVALDSATNKIGTLGAFALTAAGDFSLTDAAALKVAGAVSTTDGTIALFETAAATLDIAATLTAGNDRTILLRASDPAGAVVLGADLAAGTKGTIDLSAGTGGIIQSTGSLTAGTLRSSFGSTGSVKLASSTNQVGSLSNFSVTTGDLVLVNATGLTISGMVSTGAGTLDFSTLAGTGITSTGTLTAGLLRSTSGIAGTLSAPGNNVITQVGDITATGGDIILGNKTGTTLTIAGTLGVDPGRTIRLEADATTITTGALAAAGGTIELLAPTAAISLGAANGGDFAVLQTDLAAFTANQLNLTAKTAGITLRANLDSTAIPNRLALNAATGVVLTTGTLTAPTLELVAASGGVIQTAGVLAAKNVVSGTGGITGPVSLDNAANTIAAIGNLTATGAIEITSAAALDVAGTVKATGIALTGSAAGSALSLAGGGALSLIASGTIALATTNATGSTTLAGTIDAKATGTLQLAGAGTVTQTASTITAGTITAPSTIGGADLGQKANVIATLGTFNTTGDLTLATTQVLAASGNVTAGKLTLRSSAVGANAIDVTSPSIAIAPGGTATMVASNAAGGIAFSGKLNATPTGVLDLTAGSPGVSQSAGGITAGTLRSTGGVGGTLTLTKANAISGLGPLAATGAITLATSQSLAIAAPVNAGTGTTLSLSAAGASFSGTGALTATGGTVEIGPSTGIASFGLGTAAGDFALGNLSNVIAARVRIGQASSAGSLNKAASIALDGTVTPGATTLELVTSGAITQTTGGLAVPVLTATAVSVDIAQAGNSIGALGPLTVTGNLALANDSALAMTGALSAANITLRSFAASTKALDISGELSTASGGAITLDAANAAGGIALSGKLDATATGIVDFSAGTGGIAQSAGSITAATLQSSGGSQGAVVLDQAANAIATLGSFAVTGAGLLLRDGIALDITGTVSASSIIVRDSAASLTVSGNLSSAGAVLLAATDKAGGIVLSGTINAGVLDLSAGAGGIKQTAGSLTAAALQSTGGSTGTVALGETTNSISTLGSFTVTGADLTLVDSVALTVAGPVSAANVTLRDSAAASKAIDVTGSLTTTAGGTLTLAATNGVGGIALSGAVDASTTGIADLSAGSAGINQTGGSLGAGTLRSTGGSTGAVVLTQAANKLDALGNFAVTGAGFALADSAALTVSGAVTATAITLIDSAAVAKAIDVTGSLTATGGTIALTASNAAGGLSLAGPLNAATVDLSAGTGGIAQPGGSISATTLRAAVAGGKATLGQASNSIAALGNSTVTGGTLTVVDSAALTVSGTVKADAVALTDSAAGTAITLTGSLATTASGTITLTASNPTGAIALAGTLDATATGIVDLTAGANVTQSAGSLTAGTLRSTGGIGGLLALDQAGNAIGNVAALAVTGAASITDSVALNIAGPFSAADITVTGNAASTAISVTGSASATNTITLATGATGGIALTGTVKAATVDLSAGTGGITQSAGSITAATLQSSGGSQGAVVLDQAANAIATLGSFAVTGAGLLLRDGIALDITGTVSASSITVRDSAASLTVSGSLSTAGAVLLAATDKAGGIVLSGSVNAGVLDLSAGTGGIAQTAGSLTAGTLQSTSGSTGVVVLGEVANSVTTLGTFTVTGAAFTLIDSTAITVTGPLSAANVTLRNSAASAKAIDVTGGITTAAGGTLTLAATNGAGGLALSGTLDAGATGTVDLSALAGGISQTAGGITAANLRSSGGSTGAVALTAPANKISSLGNFAVIGAGFTLVDSTALTVAGIVQADAITLSGSAAVTAITVNGALSAPGGPLALTASNAAGGLLLNGAISADAVDLTAGSGGIAQPGGFIAATTLRVAVTGAGASLGQTKNSITALGDSTLTGGSLVLADSIALAVSGTVTADTITLSNSAAGTALSLTGSLITTAGGTITMAASNPAGAIELAGTLNATATGIADLSAGADVTQSAGIITAGSLRSTGGIGGALALPQAGNAIGTIGALAVAGDAAITDSIGLDITGTFSAANITLASSAAGANAIQVSGAVVAFGAIALENTAATGGIALAGTVTAASLDAKPQEGGLIQSAGVVTVNTLTANLLSGKIVLDQPGNAIATLGKMTATTILLRDSIPLTVAGPLSAADITLRSTAGSASALNVTGVVDASNVTLETSAPTGGIALSGTLGVGLGGTVKIATGSGGMVQTGGSVQANTLTGKVTGGDIVLAQPANQILNLINVDVAGGDVTVVTNIGDLGVNGLLARNVALRLQKIGDINVAIAGITTSAGGLVRLDAASATGGVTVQNGTLDATATGTVDITAGSGGVTQNNAAVIAGRLMSSGTIGGPVNLGGSNAIGSISDLAVTTGGFTLANTAPLAVIGKLAAQNVTLSTSNGVITLAGTGSIAAPGGIVALSTTISGGITLAGQIDASGGLLDLSASVGGVTQTGGAIAAGALASTSGITGGATLDQFGNGIGTLGAINVPAGDFNLTSSQALVVAGPLSIAAGNLTLTDSAAGTALAVTGPITVSGTARLAATAPSGGITLASAFKAATLDLVAGSGGVTQTGGALTVATLQNSGLTGPVTLAQPANSIATIGAFTVDSGDITMMNAIPLTVAGTLRASQGSVSVTDTAAGAAAITITGTVSSGPAKATALTTPNGGITVTPGGQLAAPGGPMTLTTATGINAPGTVTAGKLAVSAAQPGKITLSGANAITTLASAILADGTFTLNNAAPLTITGPVTARLLGITATGALKLSDGVLITTDGLDRVLQKVDGKLTDSQIAALKTADLGSFLAVTPSGGAPGKIETGSVAIAPFSLSKATIDLVLPQPEAGTITLGQLTGKTTDLILVTRAGGVTTGTVNVSGLLVLGGGGKADLFGTIGGLDGQAAANKANILALPNTNYRFNACPITSVNCVLLPVQTVPPLSPLRDVPIIRDRPSQDDADVQLPNVSDEDY